MKRRKDIVIEKFRKRRNRNFKGMFPIRNRTFNSVKRDVERAYSPIMGMYTRSGG
jgi:hypothetical protein